MYSNATNSARLLELFLSTIDVSLIACSESRSSHAAIAVNVAQRRPCLRTRISFILEFDGLADRYKKPGESFGVDASWIICVVPG